MPSLKSFLNATFSSLSIKLLKKQKIQESCEHDWAIFVLMPKTNLKTEGLSNMFDQGIGVQSLRCLKNEFAKGSLYNQYL